MIVIKTQMRRMPKCCRECICYMRPQTVEYLTRGSFQQRHSSCGAIMGHPYGMELQGIHVTKERPDWCPLKEDKNG